MGAPRSTLAVGTGRNRRLTERELTTLAAYENYLAVAEPDLPARFELLWSLAASTPGQRPCPRDVDTPALTKVAHDTDRHGPGRRQLVGALSITVAATVALAVLVLVVMVAHTVATIASSAGRALG